MGLYHNYYLAFIIFDKYIIDFIQCSHVCTTPATLQNFVLCNYIKYYINAIPSTVY